MITACLAIFLIFCAEINICLEKKIEKRTGFSPWRSKSASADSLTSIMDNNYDFYTHWQKIHTREVNPGTFMVNKEKPVLYRLDHKYESLHDAAIANDVKALERMLNSEAHQDHLDSYNVEGQTPVQAAVEFSSDHAISFLVKAGAQVHLKNASGEYSAATLAHAYAHMTGNVNVVSLMVLQQAFFEKTGQCLKVKDGKKKKRARESNVAPSAKQTRIIKLRRQTPKKEPLIEPQELPQDDEYDPYILNV